MDITKEELNSIKASLELHRKSLIAIANSIERLNSRLNKLSKK